MRRSLRRVVLASVAGAAVAAIVIPFALVSVGGDDGREPDAVIEPSEQSVLDSVTSAEWSADGSELYVVDAGGISIYAGSPLALSDHVGETRVNQSAFWNGDHSSAALASSEPGVEIWDLSAQDILPAPDVTGAYVPTAWSPDGSVIAVSSGTDVAIVETATGDELDRFAASNPPSGIISLAWPVADRIVASMGYSIAALDPSTGEVVWTHAGSSPYGLLAGSAASGAVVDAEARVFALEDGERLGTIDIVSRRLLALDWSPDGAWALASGDDDQPQLWSFGATTTERSLEELAPYDTGAAWSPDSRRVAIPDIYDQRIVIVDVDAADDDDDVLSIDEDVAIAAIAWSPGGDRLAAVGRDGTVFLWEMAPPG